MLLQDQEMNSGEQTLTTFRQFPAFTIGFLCFGGRRGKRQFDADARALSRLGFHMKFAI